MQRPKALLYATSQKESVTQKVLKSKKQQSKDMDTAVKNYLQQVGPSGTTVATSLDKNFADVINAAKDAVKNAPKDKAKKLQKALVSVIPPPTWKEISHSLHSIIISLRILSATSGRRS